MPDQPAVPEQPQSLNPADLLDPALGGKIRAVVAAVLALVTALLAVLQAASSVLDSLPKWQGVGAVAMFLQAAIQYVARFSSVGNKV